MLTPGLLTCLWRAGGRAARRLRRSRESGVAAMEFALIAPIMLLLLFGMVDLTDAIVAYQQVSTTAQEVGEIATQQSVQPNQTTSLTVAQLVTAETAIYDILPQARLAPQANYSVVISEIVMSGYNSGTANNCSSPCTSPIICGCWNANLAWSVPLTYGAQITRPCGLVTQTTPTAAQIGASATASTSTVPTASMSTGQASVMAIDVSYKFTPIFLSFITGPLTFTQSAYFNQRSFVSPYITLTTTGASSGSYKLCTGYT